MIKFVLALSTVLVLTVQASADENARPQPGLPVPVEAVQGNWIISERVCSSGLPVHDGFFLGKDEMSVSFRNGKYESHTRVVNCNYWANGNYIVNSDMIHLYNIVGASNCTNQVPPHEARVFFAMEADRMIIYTGPYAGGACPRGDYLKSKFIRM